MSVDVARVQGYDVDQIDAAFPRHLFDVIRPGSRVVLKPNWVLEGDKRRRSQWQHVITHPAVITAVLRRVLAHLDGQGSVAIVDAPQTDASFQTLISRYPVAQWRAHAREKGVALEVVDLRDHEWTVRRDVVISRRALRGDPRGSTEVDLVDDLSEFHGHRKSSRGYYGADYDRDETNRAHDGHHNCYRVSRTVIESDVFINLPKLKTHRKSGITACLKNLVGINTYKNFLPHHSEGGPAAGGDQFPTDDVASRVEGTLVGFAKKRLMRIAAVARVMSPLNGLARRVFGDTNRVVRSGNWHGNDTLWRMCLDLNKVLLYANPDGTLREDVRVQAKAYIGIVDAIVAGEGLGPLAPDPVHMGLLVSGTNAAEIDAVCATAMGFDVERIPTIMNAFRVARYGLADRRFDQITARIAGREVALGDFPTDYVTPCRPHFGWPQLAKDRFRVAAAG